VGGTTHPHFNGIAPMKNPEAANHSLRTQAQHSGKLVLFTAQFIYEFNDLSLLSQIPTKPKPIARLRNTLLPAHPVLHS